MINTKLDKVLFVLNPISGTKNKNHITNLITNLGTEHQGFSIEIFIWEEVSQKDEILKKIVENTYERIIVVGGDGTINMVAQALLYSNTKLAIIPMGSGNGLARHLKIPLKLEDALANAFTPAYLSIDVGVVNNKPFLCTTGLGFDAIVANEFARDHNKRGLWSYLTKSIAAYFGNRSNQYEITLNDQKIKLTAFMLTIANTNQFGNNAFIAPLAKLTDGKLNLVIVSPIPIYAMPVVIYKLFRKKIQTSKYVKTFKFKTIWIHRKNAGPYHYDGEPARGGTDFSFNLKKNALKVICQATK